MCGQVRSLRFARGFSLAILAFSITLLRPQTSPADPIGCIPANRPFAGRVEHLEADAKKLSAHEFGTLPIQPTGTPLVQKGTELNVVVDVQCLKDPERGAQSLDWLRRLSRMAAPMSKSGKTRSFSWTLEQDWDFLELQQAFEAEPCVELVSPEGRFFLHSPSSAGRIFDFGPLSDPFLRDQPHLTALRYQEALPIFFLPMLLRRQVTVAVIDTGVDFTHPDLGLNKWINFGEIAGNAVDDDRNGLVDDVSGYNFSSDHAGEGPEGDWPENRHGTHVAGLAAARIDNGVGGIGIAGVAKIMSLNVFGRNGFTRSSTLENAIRYAADERAEVINLSLGGREYSRTMRSVLRYAVRQGSFLVSAAGNDGVEICDDPNSFNFISPAVYGALIDGMIVTGSTDVASSFLSTFSNRSSRLVDIAAPGAYTSVGQLLGLLSTTPRNTYGFLAGTSMAAPVVSGSAALVITWMKAYGYPYSPDSLERIFKASARQSDALSRAVQEGRTLDLVSLALYLQRNYPPRFGGGR